MNVGRCLTLELARQHRDQQARIHAAAQERADRYVALQMQPQASSTLRFQLIEQLLLRAGQLRLLLQLPVARICGAPPASSVEQVAGRQLVDAFEHRQRRIDQPQREVLIERRQIHSRRPRVVARAAP